MTVTRALALVGLAATLLVAPPGCRVGGGGTGRIALPVGFPADVPLPARAVLTTAQDLGRKGLNLVWESAEEPPAAVAALRAKMSGAGWVLVAEALLEDGVFLSYRKQERSVAIGVNRDRNGSLVGITYFSAPWVEGAEEEQG